MNRIVRKLTTKPVWWWERHRKYAIRDHYGLLPSLEVRPAEARFVVLTTPQTLNDALWAAWSWYRFLRPQGIELQLAVDGEMEAVALAAARALFPGVRIYNVNPWFDEIFAAWPRLRAFLRQHAFAKQVGLVLGLSRQGPVLYADHDVLAFSPPVELLEQMSRQTPCYFLDHEAGCHDPALLETVRAMGLQHIQRLNAGFLYVPQNALSAALAERILADWNPLPHFYFTPQTVMSVLMQEAGAQPLPEDRYVISNRRQFYWEEDVDYEAIAARHFTGTVRHVLYRYGMPTLLRQGSRYAAEKRA